MMPSQIHFAVQLSELIKTSLTWTENYQMKPICLIREAKGIKSDSFFDMTPHIDSLHCEINNALLFKKVFVREIANPTEKKWTYLNEDKRAKEQLQAAEDELNNKLRQGIGLQKHLMQPGNYSRLLLSEKSMKIILALIPEGRRGVIQQLVHEYTLLKRVWKATNPNDSCQELLKNYPANARSFMRTLHTSFSYTAYNMPNYLHKVIAHVPELILKYGSVGAYSSEPNEHGNKLFRMLRKMCSRQTTDFELKDILKFHWLYTVKSLQREVDQIQCQQKCSICGTFGHKCSTCPNTSEL